MEDRIDQFEQELLEMLLEGDDPVLGTLRRQLRLATRRPHEMSGVGFFTHIDVPESAPRLPGNPSIRFGDVTAEIEGLQHGAGFVLFVDNGVLTMLEGYSYSETWPQTVSKYELNYMDGEQRDLAKLRKTVGWPD